MPPNQPSGRALASNAPDPGPHRFALPGVWMYVAFTGTVFGLGGLLAKGLVDDGVDPFTVTWVPFLAGGVVGLIVGAGRGHLARGALGAAVVLGLTSSAAPALLFNLGFERLPTGIVTLLISLGPVFTAAGAHFVFDDEHFNRVKGGGLVMAVAGMTVLSLGAIEGDASVMGITLVLAGSLAAGASAVVARSFATRHGAMALIAPQLATAGVAALALALALGRDFSPAPGFASWHVPALLAFGVTTYFGFLSMLKANEVGTTGQVSVIAYCIPLFGVVGGMVLFDDELTFSLIVGGLLILCAVAVIAAGSESRPRAIDGVMPD